MAVWANEDKLWDPVKHCSHKYMKVWEWLWNSVVVESESFKVHDERMDVAGDSGEVSDGNEEHVIRNWKKCDSCYKVAKNLAELCSNVLRKGDLESDERTTG